ncbi:hypothetical protein HDU92_005309 [Lobulomyces angularis]|nr:hypothetical protein HDU92_005309 [Lobulomyces angularis]
MKFLLLITIITTLSFVQSDICRDCNVEFAGCIDQIKDDASFKSCLCGSGKNNATFAQKCADNGFFGACSNNHVNKLLYNIQSRAGLDGDTLPSLCTKPINSNVQFAISTWEDKNGVNYVKYIIIGLGVVFFVMIVIAITCLCCLKKSIFSFLKRLNPPATHNSNYASQPSSVFVNPNSTPQTQHHYEQNAYNNNYNTNYQQPYQNNHQQFTQQPYDNSSYSQNFSQQPYSNSNYSSTYPSTNLEQRGNNYNNNSNYSAPYSNSNTFVSQNPSNTNANLPPYESNIPLNDISPNSKISKS